MSIYKLSGCGLEFSCFHLNVTYRVHLSKAFLDIQVTIECKLTLQRLSYMVITCSFYLLEFLLNHSRIFLSLRLLLSIGFSLKILPYLDLFIELGIGLFFSSIFFAILTFPGNLCPVTFLFLFSCSQSSCYGGSFFLVNLIFFLF